MKAIPLAALLALCALRVIGPRPAAAQESRPVRETADVALVEVPVRVVDRDGMPVRGLTETSFTVFDEGRGQTIVGFDAIDLVEKLPGSGPGPLHPAARRRFLILFDFSFSHPKAVVAARRAAREFVLAGMGENDLAAVATYSVETGIRILVTFSADRAQLARAIETLGLEAPRERRDPLAFAFDAADLPSAGGARGDTARQGSDMVEYLREFSSLHRARDDEYARGRVRHFIQTFGDLARALDVVAGRKDVIYLSEGFANRFLVGTSESQEERQWLLQGEMWKVDSDKRFGNTPLRTELAEMAQLFRRSDCVIHAVDIAGIRTGREADSDPAAVGPRETENSLYEIANGTGGEVLRNANDLGAQLGQLVNRTSLVYVLAFRPDRTGQEGRFHEIRVKVVAPGARVLSRAGYFERKGFKQTSAFERNLGAADVIANEIPVEDIPARILAMPFAADGDAASVPVLLEIPGRGLLTGQQTDRAVVEIYVYANDQDNRLGDFFVHSVGLDLSKSRGKLSAGGLRYYGELRLPPGRYRLRALVRNAETGRMGLTVSPLDVPAFVRGEPYLLPPVFLESAGEWVSVQGRRMAGGAPASMYPFLAVPGESLSPAALARVNAGSASRVGIVAYHFGARGGGDNLRIGSQILAEDGRPLEGGSLSVLGKSAPDPDGRRMLLLSFSTPGGLAPGRYGLRVILQDAATGQARQAWAPFLVP